MNQEEPLHVNIGQSINRIYSNNKDTIMVSDKAFNKYIGNQVLSVRNNDLHRKFSYRPRNNIQMGYKVDKRCLEGRSYNDYLKFIEENKDIKLPVCFTAIPI